MRTLTLLIGIGLTACAGGQPQQPPAPGPATPGPSTSPTDPPTAELLPDEAPVTTADMMADVVVGEPPPGGGPAVDDVDLSDFSIPSDDTTAGRDVTRRPAALDPGPDVNGANGLTSKLLVEATPCTEIQVGLAAYEKAGALEASGLYGPVKYRQAGCFAENGDWQNGRRAFGAVVDIAARELPGTTADFRAALRRAGLADYLWAFANQPGNEAAGAAEDFAALAGEAEAPAMLEELARWYRGRDRHADALTVFAALAAGYPDAPGHLRHGVQILTLTQLSDPGADLAALAAGLAGQVAKLRAQPDHEPGDEAPAEAALRQATIQSHLRAKGLPESERPAALDRAAGLYRTYLDLFAEHPVPSRAHYPAFMTFYQAGLLFAGERFEPAAETYELAVTRLATATEQKQRDLREQAVEGAMLALQAAVKAAERAAPPKLDGVAPKPIPELHQKLLDASERYLEVMGARGGRRVETIYLRARIYYTFNQFEPAEAGFRAVIEANPTNSIACYAALLLTDLINQRGEYRTLRDTVVGLGKKELHCPDEELNRLAGIEQQATLHVIQKELEASGRFADAAAAYLFFFETHKDRLSGRFGVIALYNAAVMLDRAGEPEEARATRQLLVDTFPSEDELVERAAAELAQPSG